MIKLLRQVRDYLQARPYWAVYLLMAVAVFINIMQFKGINSISSKNYKALHFHESDDVLILGTSLTSVRGRWLPWIMLSKIAPNAEIFIPSGSFFDNTDTVDSKLHSYGEVSDIHRTLMSSKQILDGVKPEDFIVVSIEDVLETRDPYFAFAIKSNQDEGLVPSPISGVATLSNLSAQNGAKLALVEWVGGESSLHPSQEFEPPEFYGLFIDINLLNHDVRAKLLDEAR